MSPSIINSGDLVVHDPGQQPHLYDNDYLEKGGDLVSLLELDRDLSTSPSVDTTFDSEGKTSDSSRTYTSYNLQGDHCMDDDKGESEEATKLQALTDAIKVIITCIGDNPKREGLLKTPERYAKALLSFTQGYHTTVPEVINNAIFHEQENDDMVIVKDIEVFSLCEHHLVPFTGKIHVGYIPNGRVLGLSKIARIVDVFARRLQIQERLTRQVALAVEEVLQPQGVAVMMESSHLCMVMRGVQKTSSSTTTSCMLGSLKFQSDLRKEFLYLVKGK